jgi:hypothetical protein
MNQIVLKKVEKLQQFSLVDRDAVEFKIPLYVKRVVVVSRDVTKCGRKDQDVNDLQEQNRWYKYSLYIGSMIVLRKHVSDPPPRHVFRLTHQHTHPRQHRHTWFAPSSWTR